MPGAEPLVMVTWSLAKAYPNTPQADGTDAFAKLFLKLSGTYNARRPLQPENAELPMVVTLAGIATLVRPLQPENAEAPIFVTEPGIVTDARPLQPENAPSPIPVEPEVTTAFVMAE